jgi:hypothetical protein
MGTRILDLDRVLEATDLGELEHAGAELAEIL